MANASARRLLLLSIGVFLFSFLAGQSIKQSDSLLKGIQLTKDDRTKVQLFLQISREEELRDPEKSLRYARQALKLAQMADLDSAEVRAMILMGVNLNRLNNLKEAITTGEQVVEKASRYNMNMEVAVGRGIMAVAYAQAGDFDNSSKLYFQNLKLYEKLNDKRQQGRTLGNIGADFLEQQSYAKALEYTNKALKIGIETDNLTLVTDQYNNLAAIYQVGFSDYKNAMLNYFRALSVAEKIEDVQQAGGIMLNISRIYLKDKNFDSAYFYLNRSFLIFKKAANPTLMADCYTAFGNYFFQIGDFAKGKQFALSGLKIGQEHGILQTTLEATNLLHKISLLERDTSGAYKYHLLLTTAKDSLYLLQNQKELFRIEFQYNQDIIAKEQKIKQIRSYFILGFIILGLMSGLAIIALFYSRQKIKIKNTLLEKEKAEANLNFKSKELSINLLALLKKNELIAEISHKLDDLAKAPSGSDVKLAAVKLNLEIKQNSDDRLWQEFSMRFKETNSEFYDKLTKKYPDLTQSESKLCAYLRLNMSTKEISDLTGQRPEAIEKARYRLRKKFGLNNSESNLVGFLTQI